MGAYACESTYTGGLGRKIMARGQPWAKMWAPIQKITKVKMAGVMAQVIEHLPSSAEFKPSNAKICIPFHLYDIFNICYLLFICVVELWPFSTTLCKLMGTLFTASVKMSNLFNLVVGWLFLLLMIHISFSPLLWCLFCCFYYLLCWMLT
jgi:hypothetical protein